jgi:hypothetical protein
VRITAHKQKIWLACTHTSLAGSTVVVLQFGARGALLGLGFVSVKTVRVTDDDNGYVASNTQANLFRPSSVAFVLVHPSCGLQQAGQQGHHALCSVSACV